MTTFQQKEERELYRRISRRFSKLLNYQVLEEEDRGTNHPAIIRKDEVIRYPQFERSKDWLAFYVALVFFYNNADYQISRVLDHILLVAQKYNYQGSWGIWAKFIRFFNLERTSDKMKSKPLPEFEFHLDQETPSRFLDPYEGSPFSQYYLTEFLRTIMKEDEIFGNLLRKMVKFIKLTRVESYEEASRRLARKKIKRPQRHRGYRDRGSVSDPSERARRQANRQDEPEWEVYSAFTFSSVWGQKEEYLDSSE